MQAVGKIFAKGSKWGVQKGVQITHMEGSKWGGPRFVCTRLVPITASEWQNMALVHTATHLSF